MAHPHNDWLRLFYDYGLLGVSVFVLCFGTQVWLLIRLLRGTAGLLRALVCTCLTALICFAALMVTDNVILYTAFFGAPLFMLIGLVHSGALSAGVLDRLVEA